MKNNDNKKLQLFLKILIIILALILIGGVLILIFAKGKESDKNDSVDQDSENSENLVDDPESFPLDVVIANEYKFVNESMFTKTSGNYYYSEHCLPVGKANFTIDTESYSYDPENLTNRIIHNVDTYLEKDEYLSGSYEHINALLESGSAKNLIFMDTLRLFNLPCGGEGMKIATSYKVNYPGTESAYVVVFYGSSQSVVEDERPNGFFPTQIFLISRIGTDISVIRMPSIKFWDILIDNHSLSTCVLPESYIDIFNDPSKSCVENILKTELDQTKLDALVNNALEIFELE